MSECQLELQAQGKAYPRTCPTCGLSKVCTKHGGDLPPTTSGMSLAERNIVMRELAERCLSHMGKQEFSIVLKDCHLAARAILELLDRAKSED